MGLKCGIVGLPNVGKSTLFNALSSAKAQAGNFPFCTIEPNLGVIQIPDKRLDEISKLVNPQKIVPNTIEIFDIAGLVKGSHKGEGLGNQFLSNIRSVNAIIHMLRCFEDDNIVHVDGSVNPIRDKEIIDAELQLKDLDSVEKKIRKIEKVAKTGSDKSVVSAYEALSKVQKGLEEGKSVRELDLNEKEAIHIEDLALLTMKPTIYVCNVSETDVVSGNKYIEEVKSLATKEKAECIVISAQIESEIAVLETLEEKQMFLNDLGLEESGTAKVIMSAFKLLNLISFFTAGEKEVRAWSVRRGSTAPNAAGEIHTDFERGFIRAEVIKYDDFIQYGSELACKEAGKLSVEGKNYVVDDGDIFHFRFNV